MCVRQSIFGKFAILTNVLFILKKHTIMTFGESIKTCLITKETVLGDEKPIYNSDTIATQSA